MSFRFEPAAQQELLQAARWYLEEGGARLADDFHASVYRAARLLNHMPKLGTKLFVSERAWPLKLFPYTLVYRIEPEGICILAVAHQSRKPGYWRGL